MVSRKDQKIAALVERFRGQDRDPHYLGFFECFNQQLYFEAHEVLEQLWLRERGRPGELFYKGLIQLAGAFVHLQKNRLQPAIALFGLARRNLGRYSNPHEGLDVSRVVEIIDEWLLNLGAGDGLGPLFRPERAPKLCPLE